MVHFPLCIKKRHMTDVKLFDENAPFQVKGLHMRGKLKICNAFYFSFCKGRKKKGLKIKLRYKKHLRWQTWTSSILKNLSQLFLRQIFLFSWWSYIKCFYFFTCYLKHAGCYIWNHRSHSFVFFYKITIFSNCSN